MLQKLYTLLFSREFSFSIPTAPIKKKFFIKHEKILLYGLFCSTALLLSWDFLEAFFTSAIPSGGDTPYHIVIGEYYQKNIFPSLWGYVPFWFGGFPFPQLYPPLSFIVISFVSLISHIPYETVFGVSGLISVLAIPCLIYAVSRKFGSGHFEAFCAGWIATLFVSTFDLSTHGTGLSIRDTLGVGLAPQTFSFVFFLLWLLHMQPAATSKKHEVLSVLFLSSALLTSAHSIIMLATTIVGSALTGLLLYTQKNKTLRAQNILVPLRIIVNSLIVSSIFYVPTIIFSRYIPIGPWNPIPPAEIISDWWFIIGLDCVAVYALLRSKRYWSAALSVTALAGIVVALGFPETLFDTLSIHGYRMISFFLVLSSIPIAWVIRSLVNISRPFLNTALSASILLIFITAYWAGHITPLGQTPRSNPNTSTKSALEIAAYLKKNPRGLVQIESYDPSRENSYGALNAVLARNGIPTTFGFATESTPGSTFMVAIRNALSKTKTVGWLDSNLHLDPNFLNQPVSVHLVRASLLSINQFIVQSPDMVRALLHEPSVFLEKDFGVWKLFSARAPAEQIRVLNNAPALLLADTKNTNTGYSQVRFYEELFASPYFDRITLVTPETNTIKDLPDLERFSAIIISDYRDTGIDSAIESLSSYSVTKPLILIENESPIFSELSKIPRENHKIHIIPSPMTSTSLQTIFDIVHTNTENTGSKEDSAKKKDPVRSFDKDTLTLTSIPLTVGSKKTPVSVSANYFPGWIDTVTQEEPLMAYPANMVIWTNAENVQLRFEKPQTLTILYLLWLLGALLVIATYISRKN